MSSGGGGGSGVPADTTNVQTIREAPEIEARRLGLMDAAVELAKKKTSPPAFQIAPMSAAEQQGLTLAGQTGAGAGAISDAYAGITAASTAAGQNLTGATTAAGRQFSATDVQAAMNPYIQNVVNRIGESYAAKETDLSSRAIQAGAFGGGREGVGIAELQRQKADVLGGVYGQGYTSALGELQTQRGLEAQTALQAGAGQLQRGQLEQMRLQGAQLQQQGQAQDIQSLMGAGGVQRGISQAELEATRQTGLQTIQEPYQRVAFVSDIQSGVPSASQQRLQTTYAPQPSPLGQAVGTGIGAYAAFAPK